MVAPRIGVQTLRDGLKTPVLCAFGIFSSGHHAKNSLWHPTLTKTHELPYTGAVAALQQGSPIRYKATPYISNKNCLGNQDSPQPPTPLAMGLLIDLNR